MGLGLALRANLEGIEAGTYKKNARNHDIVVKLAERQGKEQVNRRYATKAMAWKPETVG